MLVWEDGRFPQDVQDLARRVDRWRRKRVGRARMPEGRAGSGALLLDREAEAGGPGPAPY